MPPQTSLARLLPPLGADAVVSTDPRDLARRIPAGFRLGAATAAYQIEGAADEDGKSPSIWDEFAQRPGAVIGGDPGRVAADHYHRVPQDVALLRHLGIDDYRFSISWPRIVPGGSGPVNQAGVDFYSRLVDELLAAGIRPVPTLFHWDLPAVLQHRGGWLERSTAHAFADYAHAVGTALSDRVEEIVTLNEPNVHILYGYGLTDHAPGLGLGLGALPAAHHLLLGHGLAVQALRAAGTRRVGVVVQHAPVVPASDEEADVVAAGLFADLVTWSFADPILTGTTPDWIAETLSQAGIDVAADLPTIAQPLDLYGLNYYEPTVVEAPRAGADYSGVLEVDIPEDLPFSPVTYPAAERTDFGWPVAPEGLTHVLRELHERYPQAPTFRVTESGASYHDGPDATGAVPDRRRIDYLARHLSATLDALEAGVDVDGYYVWSALDNVEWAAGTEQRFGLVHVDFETLERTVKDSGHWWREVSRVRRAD